MVLKIICTIKESWMSDQIFIYLLPDLNVTSVLLTLLVFRQLLEDNAGYYLHFCTVNWSNKYRTCIKAWYIFIELCCHRKTIYNISLLHSVTCSFITMNTYIVVYFDSFTHTSSCCYKYSLEHQTVVNPLLKIVPINCFLQFKFSLLKTTSPAVLVHFLLLFFKRPLGFL